MTKAHPFCGSLDHPHLSRRTLLGSAAVAGFSLAADMSALECFGGPLYAGELRQDQKSVILLWLAGGASQLETWDPKPGAATGGPFGSIGTSVSGVRISELMPRMASRFHEHTAIIRSLNTRIADHGGGARKVLKGRLDEASLQYPDLGAMIAKELGRADSQVPDFVAFYSQSEGRSHTQIGPGFLGSRYAPMNLNDETTPPNIRRLEAISAVDHADREAMRKLLSERFLRGRMSNTASSHNTAYSRVRGLMASEKLFDIEQEPQAVRDRYGKSTFGQQCLVARRLVEAGVPFVRIGRAWWDSHDQNFETHLELVSELDQVMSVLLDDLQERGLLSKTLVIALGEFGRTPKINAGLGRDHFADAWSCSLSGCGIRPGVVYGETDENGQQVKSGEIDAGDLFATIFQAVGIDHHKDYYVGSRPIPLTNPEHEPVREVLS